MQCAKHPTIETNLTCGKCGTPICPKCMVQTPVGIRCKTCARLNKLPTYQMTASHYLRAAGTGIGVAVICGFIWGMLDYVLPFFFLSFIIAAGAGYAIGEVIALSVNRKRGKGLAIIGGCAAVLSFAVAVFAVPVMLHIGMSSLLLGLISMVIAVAAAVMRLR